MVEFLLDPCSSGRREREGKGDQGERFVITGAYKSTAGTQSEESRSRGTTHTATISNPDRRTLINA